MAVKQQSNRERLENEIMKHIKPFHIKKALKNITQAVKQGDVELSKYVISIVVGRDEQAGKGEDENTQKAILILPAKEISKVQVNEARPEGEEQVRQGKAGKAGKNRKAG